MKIEKVSGKATAAYGKGFDALKYDDGKTPLPKGTILKFVGTYTKYESAEELRNAGQWPNEKKVLDWYNAAARNNARAKAQQDAFDASGIVKPTRDNDPMIRLKEMVKILVAAGQAEAEARTNAAAMLNINLDEIDESESDDE